MAERSQFWDTGTTGDGTTTITQAQTTEWFRDATTPRSGATSGPNTSQGIYRGVMNELAVSGAASPVSVNSGAATVAGFYYKNDAAVNVAVATPAANTRIDRVVLRAVYGVTRTVRITLITGVEGLGTPPALTQSDGATWDIPLAQVSITTGGVITVTDERVFAQFATNHVKRDGDTMTGQLVAPSIAGANPVRLDGTTAGAAVDNRLVQFSISNTGGFFAQLLNDARTLVANWLEVTRSGQTISQVNFPSGGDVVRSGGNPILHTGNMALRVVTAWIDDLAVTTGKIAGGAVTTSKIATGGVETLNIKDGAVTGAKVQDFSLGVSKWEYPPQRKGGDALAWWTPGTSNYSVPTMRIQFGVATVTIPNLATSAFVSVPFPILFSQPPIVYATIAVRPSGSLAVVAAQASGGANAVLTVQDTTSSGSRVFEISWLALGPA
jgi:hypothetical protein